MMPDAGHLQHMPAHILQRVGRYEDAAQANRDGVIADVAYMGATPPLDYYGMYLAHNYQFLGFSAAMEGRKAEALDASVKMSASMPVEMLLMMPGADWYMTQRYMTLIRFGQWDDMLNEPAPDKRLVAQTGGYFYARAVAFAAKGNLDDARRALAGLDTLAGGLAPDAGAGLNSAKDVLAVAGLVARGQIARAANQPAEAIARLREAVAKEDQLAYDEPADWFLPVRHQLGAALLAAGKAEEADQVYAEDLRRHPHNGWALAGRIQALRTLKKTQAADALQREFADAWKHADVTIAWSVF
jgi:hypothetical protein